MFYIENTSLDPYFNLALEEYFMTCRTDLSDIFLLWQNEPTVVVGRHQNVEKEVNLPLLAEKGVNLIRRNSGGGAVYHDLGNLNYTFITADTTEALNFTRFTQPVILALAKLGVVAENSGRNDILIQGRKISGNAQYRQKARIMHHGTLLFASDLDEVEAMLTADPAKLKARGVPSVRSRVTNISEYLSKPWSIEEFKQSLLEYMEEYTKITYLSCTNEDLSAIEDLRREKYLTPAWNYGAPYRYNAAAAERFPWGQLGCQLWIQDEVIVSGKLFGDFFCRRELNELENQLRGISLTDEHWEETVGAIPAGDYIEGLQPEEWSHLLKMTIQKVKV